MSINKNNQKGEIVTALTIGTVIVLGAITLISSIFLPKNQQTIKSRASEDSTLCRDSTKEWKCNKDNKIADKDAKYAFCGVYANLINGTNFDKVIDKWREEHERNMKYNSGACGGTSTAQSPPVAGGQPAPAGTGGGVKSNGCFSLKAEFEQKLENGKVAFYTWVTFESATAGDVELLANGQHAAGWNGFGGGRFTYDPNWTHPGWPGNWGPIAIVDLNNKVNAGYEGFLRNCNPQSITINCTLTANANGTGSVSGESGCICKNCAATAPAAASVVSTAPAAAARPGAATAPVTTCGGTTPILTNCAKYGDASGTYCPVGTNPNTNPYYVWSGKGSYIDAACNTVTGVLSSYCCSQPPAPGAAATNTGVCAGQLEGKALCADIKEILGRTAFTELVCDGKGKIKNTVKFCTDDCVDNKCRVVAAAAAPVAPAAAVPVAPAAPVALQATCKESYETISVGTCYYYVPDTVAGRPQNCGNGEIAFSDSTQGCMILRECPASKNSEDTCLYNCFSGGTQVNCKGAGDVHSNTTTVTIYNDKTSRSPLYLWRIHVIKHAAFGILSTDKTLNLAASDFDPSNPDITKLVELAPDKTSIHDLTNEVVACKSFAQSVEATLYYVKKDGTKLSYTGWGNCTGGVNILLRISN